MQDVDDRVAMQNGTLGKETAEDRCVLHRSNENSLNVSKLEVGSDMRKSQETVESYNCINKSLDRHPGGKPDEKITNSLDRRSSKTPEPQSTEKRRISVRSLTVDQQEGSVCTRRVSVPANKVTPKKKCESAQQHVVSKSELWDTGSQHRCNKAHQKSSRISLPQEEGKLNQLILCKILFET